MTFVEEIQALANAYPDHPAVECLGGEVTTLAQLWQMASQYAERLESEGHTRVVLCYPRGPGFIAALLGCWIQGRTAVILDSDWPEERKTRICKQVSAGSDLERGDPAYIIFSSGSTGEPKGIVVSHAGLLPMLRQQIAMFWMVPGTRSLWLHGVAFDATLSDVGTALLSLSTLCFFASEPPCSPQQWLQALEEHRISHCDIPPALLEMLDAAEAPACLQSLVIGGSVCSAATVRAWAERLHLVNVYGPTEATICTSMVKCTSAWEVPNIGKPMAGVTYEIDADGQLIISGAGVALGYLGLPELTQQRFGEKQGRRYFRTGDQVRQLPNGEFVFLGRLDRQFKKQGKLICPEEIESVICDHPNVRECFVDLEGGRLVAWVSLRAAMGRAEFLAFAVPKLPAWMLPTHWQVIDKLPRLTSGKVDRSQLNLSASPNHLEPSGPLVERITQLLRVTLAHAEFTANDDFFEWGGDSLLAMRLLSLAASQGISFSPDCLYRQRTAARIAESIGDPAGYIRSSEELLAMAKGEFAKLRFVTNERPPTDGRHVLLTGATGFLGSALLGEILTRGHFRVTCLVRGNLAERRSHVRWLLAAHGYSPKLEFELVSGMLEQRRFGLPDADWQGLADSCSHIIHCGASTHALASYDMLRATNVTGTAEILAFQRQGCCKMLLYASTLSVFVDASPVPPVCEEMPLNQEATQVLGGYAQSKWVAEQLIQLAASDANPCKVLRLGLLTPNSQTGFAASSDRFTQHLLGKEAFPRLEALPTGASMDFTPVDYAAQVVADILHNEPSATIFHVANPQPLPAALLFEAIQSSKIPLQVALEAPSQASPHALFKTTGTRFATTNSHSLRPFPEELHSLSGLVDVFNKVHDFSQSHHEHY